MKAAMPFTISDLRQCPEFFDTVADRIGRRGRPASSIRRHEDRQTETGEMVQRLIDPDQPPEPLLLLLHREGGDAKSRGAIIRISTIATARCTRQCASNGSAQPLFWSLPTAIHLFCRKKSATTCLAVRSSIHPTRAPTGTDDDMAGNDKADALWNGSAQVLLKPGQLN